MESRDSHDIACHKWNIMHLFPAEDGNVSNYGLIILNRPISHNKNCLVNMWKRAAATLTADGGTDRWDTFLQSLDGPTREMLHPPDIISGDFDSIKQETLEKYKERGSKIVHTPNQDATDFTKAVIEMDRHCIQANIPIDSIIVLAENSGRLDHIMGNINTLFLCLQSNILKDKATRVYLMSSDSVSWLLWAGRHRVQVPVKMRESESWCALVPIGEECSSVTTSGLKWNLDNQSLKFGGLVSTSNTYNGSETVHIECSHPLLWSMDTAALFPEEILKK